jgi:hypothetical protein
MQAVRISLTLVLLGQNESLKTPKKCTTDTINAGFPIKSKKGSHLPPLVPYRIIGNKVIEWQHIAKRKTEADFEEMPACYLATEQSLLLV